MRPKERQREIIGEHARRFKKVWLFQEQSRFRKLSAYGFRPNLERRFWLIGLVTTFSAHTASPPPPSRTPAGLRASSREASIAPRITSARGPPAWRAPRTRNHRSVPAPPMPAGASRLPRTVPCPAPASDRK